jgi:AcrR family transcriptional regulator
MLADRILDVAGRLFGTQRFHEVRMDDIAAEADVGKGTLYRYFRDKEELYLALLARASEQFTRRLREAATRGPGPRQRLEIVVTTIIDYFDEHPHLLELILRAEIMQVPDVENPWQEARDDLYRIVGDIFAEGARRKQYCIADPDLAMLMLLGGVRAVIRFGKQPRPANLGGCIVQQFLAGHSCPE